MGTKIDWSHFDRYLAVAQGELARAQREYDQAETTLQLRAAVIAAIELRIIGSVLSGQEIARGDKMEIDFHITEEKQTIQLVFISRSIAGYEVYGFIDRAGIWCYNLLKSGRPGKTKAFYPLYLISRISKL